MYHQISRNKRNSVFVIVGFLAVWLVAGLIIGWLAYGQGGAVAGAIVIGMAALIASAFWNSVGRMRMRGQGALIVLAIGIVFTLIAFLVGPLMQLALSRQRESLADVSGVELTRNPAGLISALQKIASNDKPPERFNHAVAAMMIDNPSEHHGSFFSRLFDTHPPIEERIAALQKIASVKQT